MSRQDEVKKEQEKIKRELNSTDRLTSIKNLIKRVKHSHFFLNQPDHQSIEDEALENYFNSMKTEEKKTLFKNVAAYRAEQLLGLGSKATDETNRLIADPINATYDIDLKEAKYNWDVIDKTVLYSTKLLNPDVTSEIQAMDRFLNHPSMKNLDLNPEDMAIEHLAKDLRKNHPEYETKISKIREKYSNGKEVYESESPEYAKINVNSDQKTVNVQWNPEFLKKEDEVHHFVESKKVNEKATVSESVKRILREAERNGGKIQTHSLNDMATVLSISSVWEYDNIPYHKKALREYTIREEKDYKARQQTMTDEFNKLKENPHFYAYMMGIENVRTYFQKTPSALKKDWDQYANQVKTSLAMAELDQSAILVVNKNQKDRYTVAEIQSVCENQLKQKNGKKKVDYKIDLKKTAGYFVMKYLMEPGAKRTFFGKGTNWNETEQTRLRENLKADQNGTYDLASVNRAIKTVRDGLLSDPNFLRAAAGQKTMEETYQEYKNLMRKDVTAAALENESALRMAKSLKGKEREDYINSTSEVVLSKEYVDYLRKTKNELDTLYKSGGKFRSSYMKELYKEMKNVIDQAAENEKNGNGLTVNSGRVKELQSKAVKYFEKRKGKFFDAPTTDWGKARLDIVEGLIRTTDKEIARAEKEGAKKEESRMSMGRF